MFCPAGPCSLEVVFAGCLFLLSDLQIQIWKNGLQLKLKLHKLKLKLVVLEVMPIWLTDYETRSRSSTVNQGAMRQRFFLAASSLVSSVFSRRRTHARTSSHARKNLWYPGYSFPRFCTLSIERFWFLFWSILNGVTLKTSNRRHVNHVSRVITWFLFNFSYSSKLEQITNLNMTFYMVVPVPYTTPKWLITNWNVTIMGSLEIRAWYQRYMYFFTCQFF